MDLCRDFALGLSETRVFRVRARIVRNRTQTIRTPVNGYPSSPLARVRPEQTALRTTGYGPSSRPTVNASKSHPTRRSAVQRLEV